MRRTSPVSPAIISLPSCSPWPRGVAAPVRCRPSPAGPIRPAARWDRRPTRGDRRGRSEDEADAPQRRGEPQTPVMAPATWFERAAAGIVPEGPPAIELRRRRPAGEEARQGFPSHVIVHGRLHRFRAATPAFERAIGRQTERTGNGCGRRFSAARPKRGRALHREAKSSSFAIRRWRFGPSLRCGCQSDPPDGFSSP